jgi:hypothetical protein
VCQKANEINGFLKKVFSNAAVETGGEISPREAL